MMSQPALLADFIRSLSTDQGADPPTLELCINGDFVDFLAIAEFQAWTADPQEASRKLERTIDSPFRCVFDALAIHLERGHALSIVVGNHDLELVHPQVQRTLLAALRATPRQIRFIDDGSAYQLGGLLIEHGNRYDGANVNDWTGLRAIRSAGSRYESAPAEASLQVAAGSELVHALVSPLKGDYPFIDLLKPEGELLALLLLALEPRRIDFPKVRGVLNAQRRQDDNLHGLQPDSVRNIGARLDEHLDPELQGLFAAELAADRDESSYIARGLRDRIYILSQFRRTGLGPTIRAWYEQPANAGTPVALPSDRLRKIHAVLRRILVDDTTFASNGDIGPYGLAADRIRTQSLTAVETVVMGHTHLARHIGHRDKAVYINTGTWADLVYLPPALLAPWESAGPRIADQVRDFLVQLVLHPAELRHHHLTYADIVLDAGGAVRRASLEVVRSTMQDMVDAHTAATQRPLVEPPGSPG